MNVSSIIGSWWAYLHAVRCVGNYQERSSSLHKNEEENIAYTIITVYRRKGAYPWKTAFPEPYPEKEPISQKQDMGRGDTLNLGQY